MSESARIYEGIVRGMKEEMEREREGREGEDEGERKRRENTLFFKWRKELDRRGYGEAVERERALGSPEAFRSLRGREREEKRGEINMPGFFVLLRRLLGSRF